MYEASSRSDISLKIRDQTGRVRVSAVGAVAQALQQLLQQTQITEGKRFIVAPWRHVASNALKGDKDLGRAPASHGAMRVRDCNLMRPFPADLMRMWPISTRVNKPENDNSSIIEPIELETA